MRAEWQQHIDELTGQYQKLRAGVADTQRRLTELTATAKDTDGRIKVTVDHQGRPQHVELDPTAVRELSAEQLGALMVQASRAAAAEVDAQRDKLLEPALQGHLARRVAAARGPDGRVDVTKLFPGDPAERIPRR